MGKIVIIMDSSQHNTLIKGGTIVTPDEVVNADLLVVDGIIADISENLDGPDARSIDTRQGLETRQGIDTRIIDAKGKILLPGGIDVHTHFNLDIGVAIAQDDFYTGTIAAAMGGTTTIVDHPGFGPEGCSLFHQIEKYHDDAKNCAVIDYSFHGVLQHLDENIIEQIPKLAKQGITSMKTYMTYDHRFDDAMLLTLFKVAKKHNVLIAVHAENHDLIQALRQKFIKEQKKEAIYHALSRPDKSESEAVKRLIDLSSEAGNAPVYIVHLSTRKGVEAVKYAQEAGKNVFAETCPQYLVLDEDNYRLSDHEGLKYVMSPPLRSCLNQPELWKGLMDNTISTVATDHCPFDFKLKKQLAANDFSKCPGGAPGIEARMGILYSKGVGEKKISLNQFAKVTAENPAKLMGMYPKKGILSKGADADIVIWDPDKKVTIKNDNLHENVDYTPYEGMEVQGWPTLTMVRGRIVVQDNIFVGEKGYGKFIKRKPYMAVK